MAKQAVVNLPGEIIEHRMFDGGEVIAIVSYSKVMEYRGPGPPTMITRGDSIRTVDGLVYNPVYATGASPILLAVCDMCRHPGVGLPFFRETPCHGLCSLPNARQCVRCGITVCPRHSQSSKGKAYCRRCARLKRWWRLIKPLFFRRIEE